MASLALGFIFVGSADGDVTGTILQAMMEREEKELDEKWARFMGLGLALLYLGQQDASDATIETLKAIEHPLSKTTQILVDVCSYAGTGNVLKIQNLLHHCNDHIDPEKEPDLHQAFAVIGIAVISMGEDIGAEMSLRQFDHLVGPVERPSSFWSDGWGDGRRVLNLFYTARHRCTTANR